MSDLHLLYICGAPGSGKTTLAAELVKGLRRRVYSQPFAHTRYETGLVQLGRERSNGFGGCDALSMSVSPKAIAALGAHMWPRILAEGDRLAHDGFFSSAQKAGYSLEVVLLDASEATLEARRAERGSKQDPSWVKGRVSRTERLRSSWVTCMLDATLSVEELAMELKDHAVFRGGE